MHAQKDASTIRIIIILKLFKFPQLLLLIILRAPFHRTQEYLPRKKKKKKEKCFQKNNSKTQSYELHQPLY